MRLNQFLAKHTDLSRRSADQAITEGRVEVNGIQATLGDIVIESDKITLDGRAITPVVKIQTVLLNKPVGYVCSRDGQGSRTIYDLLPTELQRLNPVGRLDKDSSGLLLLTNDGELANLLTHPRYEKVKIYEVKLHKPLTNNDKYAITTTGVSLDDGNSRLGLKALDRTGVYWQVIMREGRNRQIRRTFSALGYTVRALHRTNFGNYTLADLKIGEFSVII